MLAPVDGGDRKKVIAPTAAGPTATKPKPDNTPNVHPVQPARASPTTPGGAKSPQKVVAASTRAIELGDGGAAPQRKSEPLAQAIYRMFAQGYNGQQIMAQIKRWHPDWSIFQVGLAMMEAPKPGTPPPKPKAPRLESARGDDSRASSFLSHLGRDVARLAGHAAHSVEHGASAGANVAVDTLAVFPYAKYYAAYQVAAEVEHVGARAGKPGKLAAKAINAPLALMQAVALAQDAAIDFAKGESVRDEGRRGYINPIHSHVPRRIRGPQVYLPGLTPHGVDIKW